MTKTINSPYVLPASSGHRGNTTRGAGRRGNKKGRASDYPPGTQLHHVALRLSEPEYADALHLGYGLAAKGIRRALAMAAPTLPPNRSQDRITAYAEGRRRAKLMKSALLRRAYYGSKRDASASPDVALEWDDLNGAIGEEA